VLLTRVGHGAISAAFLGCIAALYLAAWRGRVDAAAYAALAALGLESALVLLNRGDCPLGPLLARVGDDTPFFELFLPPRAAKAAVPVLGGVVVVGALAFAARVL
jgi:hypothetical protein